LVEIVFAASTYNTHRHILFLRLLEAECDEAATDASAMAFGIYS